MARPMISRNANPFLPTIHSAVLQKDSPLYRAMRMACLLRCICSIKEANKAIRLIYTTFLKASMDGLSADANSEAARLMRVGEKGVVKCYGSTKVNPALTVWD